MSGEFDLLVKTMAMIDAVLEQNPRATAKVEDAMSEFQLCPICHYAPVSLGERECMACSCERIERESRYEAHLRERAYEESEKEM